MGKYEHWEPLHYFVELEDDQEAIKRYQRSTHGIYGDMPFILTEANIEALRAGKLLAYGDGEYTVLIKLEEQA